MWSVEAKRQLPFERAASKQDAEGESQDLEEEDNGLSREEFEIKRDYAVQPLNSNDRIGRDCSFGRNGRVSQIKGYTEMYG